MRVLTYERTDPRDGSIAWMSNQGLEVRAGRADSDPAFRSYTPAEIVADAAGCTAVLGSSAASFPRAVIEALPDLRFISKIGIGVDTIDIAAATERGILVNNTPDAAGVVAVAEHAIAMMLALRKRLPTWTPAFIRAGGWRGQEFATMMEHTSVGSRASGYSRARKSRRVRPAWPGSLCPVRQSGCHSQETAAHALSHEPAVTPCRRRR
jgi:D-3-phosphoglycerate dehydrogenase